VAVAVKRVQTVGTTAMLKVDSQGRAIANPQAGTPTAVGTGAAILA
jgi:hypothetical protein